MLHCSTYRICFTILLLTGYWANAQTVFKTTPDRQSILIGEPVQLHVELHLPASATYQVVIPDSPLHWQWIHQGAPQLSYNGDRLKLAQDLTFTGFDTGYWPIPVITLRSGGGFYSGDTAGVRVQYAFPDTREAFRDIKDIEILPPAPSWNRYLLIFGLPLIVLGLWALYRFRRPRPAAPKALPVFLAFTDFTAALDQLEQDLSLQHITVKQAYIQLNHIFREYLFWKQGRDTREQTTAALIVTMQRAHLPENIFEALADTLRLSDFVKFARYQPEAVQIQHSFRAIRDTLTFIQNLS